MLKRCYASSFKTCSFNIRQLILLGLSLFYTISMVVCNQSESEDLLCTTGILIGVIPILLLFHFSVLASLD